MIELGATRYGGSEDWHACQSLREALELGIYFVDANVAYPIHIRVDGMVRWERLPDEHLNFRWRRVSS